MPVVLLPFLQAAAVPVAGAVAEGGPRGVLVLTLLAALVYEVNLFGHALRALNNR